MSTLNLDKLFQPKSVAVIGASNRPGAVGYLVMRNLLEGGFDGPIMPVNPRRQSISGVLTYPSVKELPITPDVAVVCTPPSTVPQVIEDLGAAGGRAAIVLTAGLSREKGEDGAPCRNPWRTIAKSYDLRILGPNCLGLLVPGIGLNASFSHLPALPGKIAFISQSGALCTSVLDWARTHEIGFSHFISMGDTVDIDFGDVIDYLGSDPHTRAILLYIESIKERRNFMSAARAAARNKPLLVIKSGRVAEGAAAAASHTGALAGADDVYDAAISRAGMLRVYSIDELFAASETLSRARPLEGERLAIMTNGGGAGVLAVDALIQGGGKLADLSEETPREARRPSAGHLVEVQPGRHHRRRAGRALRPWPRRPGAGPRGRLYAGHALPDGDGVQHRGRQGDYRHRQEAQSQHPDDLDRRRSGRRIASPVPGCRHSDLRDPGSRRAGLHASGPLPPKPGHPDPDPAVGADRFHAGHRRRSRS